MINANELRIGNYVKRIDIPGNWYKIRAHCTDQVYPINVVEQDWAKNCFWASDCTLSDLEPIPLEEDILLKFGFEFTGECYVAQFGNKFNFLLYEGDGMDEYQWKITGSRYVDIHYVHQLQNLIYALFETELIYKP